MVAPLLGHMASLLSSNGFDRPGGGFCRAAGHAWGRILACGSGLARDCGVGACRLAVHRQQQGWRRRETVVAEGVGA